MPPFQTEPRPSYDNWQPLFKSAFSCLLLASILILCMRRKKSLKDRSEVRDPSSGWDFTKHARDGFEDIAEDIRLGKTASQQSNHNLKGAESSDSHSVSEIWKNKVVRRKRVRKKKKIVLNKKTENQFHKHIENEKAFQNKKSTFFTIKMIISKKSFNKVRRKNHPTTENVIARNIDDKIENVFTIAKNSQPLHKSVSKKIIKRVRRKKKRVADPQEEKIPTTSHAEINDKKFDFVEPKREDHINNKIEIKKIVPKNADPLTIESHNPKTKIDLPTVDHTSHYGFGQKLLNTLRRTTKADDKTTQNENVKSAITQIFNENFKPPAKKVTIIDLKPENNLENEKLGSKLKTKKVRKVRKKIDENIEEKKDEKNEKLSEKVPEKLDKSEDVCLREPVHKSTIGTSNTMYGIDDEVTFPKDPYTDLKPAKPKTKKKKANLIKEKNNVGNLKENQEDKNDVVAGGLYKKNTIN